MQEEKFRIGNLINAGVCGFIFAWFFRLFVLLILPIGYNLLMALAFWVGWIGFSYWIYKTHSIKHMWGRTVLALGIEQLALPIGVFLFELRLQEDVASALGAAIGYAFSISNPNIYSGIIFIIIGYLMVRKK